MRSFQYFIVVIVVLACLVTIQFWFSMKATKVAWNQYKNESRRGLSKHSSLIPLKRDKNQLDAPIKEEDDTENDTAVVEENDEICQIYMAPSTIPNSGMGVFTAHAVDASDIIMPQDGPVIPILDMEAPNEFKESWLTLFRGYVWGHPSATTAELFFEADYTVDYQLSLGMFPNCHTFLDNLNFIFQNNVYDDSSRNLKIEDNPGSGAYSYHVGRTFTTTKNLDAGDEIFLNYGDGYVDGNPHMKDVPRSTDYRVAGDIMLELFAELKEQKDLFHTDATQDQNKESAATVDEALSRIKQSFDSKDQLNDRIVNLLPKNFEEIKEIFHVTNENDDSNSAQNLSVTLAKRALPKRGVDWLVKNGICMDNIMPGPSDILTAGQGAKARRNLKKDSLITPAPLLQILNRDGLSMHRVYNHGDGGFDHHYDEKSGFQLLMNYCFGHTASSLLLCPTTNTILINHCSKDCGGEGLPPNAKVQWSKDESTQKWLEMTLDEMAEHPKEHGLTFDFIATRDIKRGEEIYIDYGSSWEDAWLEHSLKWKEKFAHSDEPHYSTTILNNLDVPLEETLTKIKSENSKQIFTACLYWDNPKWLPRKKKLRGGTAWHQYQEDEIKDIFASNGEEFSKERKGTVSASSWWPCSIVNRDNNDDDNPTYRVRIFQSSVFEKTEWSEMDYPRFLTDFPRASIRFFHLPYTSPVHRKEAFRRHIEISAKMFPVKWLDRREKHGKFEIGSEVYARYSYGKITGISSYRKYDVHYNNGKIDEGVNEDEIYPAHQGILSGITSHPFH